MAKLTKKQEMFALEYLIDLNATRAYRIAYPNCKKNETAAQAGSRLLRNVKVSAYIEDQLAQIQADKVADAKEVLEYLSTVLRGESESAVVVVEGIGEGCSEARTIAKTPDERERLKAAELLGKRYGIFLNKTELTGCVPVIIKDDVNDDGD